MKPLVLGMSCVVLLGLVGLAGAEQTNNNEGRAVQPTTGQVAPPPSPSLNSRIIFIGDSITGHHGWRLPDFWIHRVGRALKAVDPNATPTLVSLGGSGAGVGGWPGAIERSKTEEFSFDIKEFVAKTELDQPAEIVMIMLGANDVFAPYVSDDEASLKLWEDNYRKLIAAVRERNHPGCVALATVTPLTEDMKSAKNVLVDKLNERVAKLAAETNCVLVPTNETFREILAKGRELQPDFHVIPDEVHPGPNGHVALTLAVLRGLGFTEAADRFEKTDVQPIWEACLAKRPLISWSLSLVNNPEAPNKPTQVLVKYFWHPLDAAKGAPLTVTVRGPQGWAATPARLNAPTGAFTLETSAWRLQNKFAFEVKQGTAAGFVQEFTVPAPWWICRGVNLQPWGFANQPPEAMRTSWDEAVEKGEDVTQLPTYEGKPINWTSYFPTVDYVGLDDTGSVDYFSIANPAAFEAGYGVRYLRSDKDRDITMRLESHLWAGRISLGVWVNGQKAYAGVITDEPDRTAQVAAHLKHGWNTLVFKSAHQTYFWQQTISLLPVAGDSLDQLVVSLAKP